MSKLTLSVEKSVISRARRYAKRQGVSISEMVETYLSAVVTPTHKDPRRAPILQSLRGTLKKADIKQYRNHLVAKYR